MIEAVLFDLDGTLLLSSQTCKPHVNYFHEICDALCIGPEKCLMVGDHYKMDGPALELGMQVYMLSTEIKPLNALPAYLKSAQEKPKYADIHRNHRTRWLR